MSFRPWLYVFAIGVAYLGAWFSWDRFSAYQQNQANERHYSTSYYSEASKKGVNTCNSVMDESGFLAWLACFAQNPPPNNEVNQAEHDLKAQQDMAAWALGMLLVTLWLTGITLIGVFFVGWTLRTTQKMANDAEKFGRNQTRAYIAIGISNVVIEVGKPFSAVVKAQNCGSTPAIGLRISGRVRIVTKSDTVGSPNDAMSSEISDIGSFVEPGGHCHTTIYTERKEILTAQDVIDIRGENKSINGYVYFPYRDIFQNQCWTCKDFAISGD